MTQQDDADDAEESILAAIGFLFEGSETTTLKRFKWECPLRGRSHDEDFRTTMTIQVSIHLVDDEPGAVQSGHFLWPAAPALCDFLIVEQQSPPHQQDATSQHPPPIHPRMEDEELDGGFFLDPDASSSSCYRPQNVVELGAGCALSSWFALQLYHTTLQRLVVTDHDPSVLRRAKDNYETTLEELYERAAFESSSPSSVQEEVDPVLHHLSGIPVRFEALSWGQSEEAITRLLQAIPCSKSCLTTITTENDNSTTMTTTTTTTKTASCSEPLSYFDLVLGSDLIDCIEVIEPLLTTASRLMQPPPLWAPLLLSQSPNGGECHRPKKSSRFLLSQSFPYDCEMEQEIETVATKLGFQRIIHDTATTSTTVDHFNGSNNNNNIHKDTVSSGGVGHTFIRIQEFRCMGV
jgi:hypothetical protein